MGVTPMCVTVSVRSALEALDQVREQAQPVRHLNPEHREVVILLVRQLLESTGPERIDR